MGVDQSNIIDLPRKSLFRLVEDVESKIRGKLTPDWENKMEIRHCREAVPNVDA